MADKTAGTETQYSTAACEACRYERWALPDAPRVPMNDGKSFADFDTALYDLENDPKQERPIVNDKVTQNLLKAVSRILNDHDAPSEMYDWYNLKLAKPA